MKKYTCTFPPKGTYRILRQNEIVRKGDKFNYKHPNGTPFDYWSTHTGEIDNKVKTLGPKWVVIRSKS